MLLTPGQVLSERYRVIGLLGQGGMAAVYCAHDRTLDRLVAIKQLRPDPLATERAIQQSRQQFRHEAQILATLDHPNLPRVTDYFERDGIEYLVMDYVEGQALSEVVEKHGGGLEEARVLEWANQLLAALEYIHRHGIIHRDVKPSNIRLTPDERIFLVDFGLVKLFDAANLKTATVMRGLGTPEYAPPEQYDAHLGHTDPRSDIYALGATLYHLLTGNVPATATQRVADPGSFRSPRALGAHISAETERAILRAMELQRSRRYESASEMRAALQQAQRRTSSEAPLTGLTRQLPRWAAMERGTLARRVAPFAVIALVLVGGVLGLTNGNGAEPAASPSLTATSTPTPRPAADAPTASPTSTATPTRRATRISGVSGTDESGPFVNTPTATRTRTLRPTATRTPTSTPTSTPVPPRPRTATFTPAPSFTPTRTPTRTITLTPSDTPTRTPVDTPVSPTETPTAPPGTPTPVTPTDTPALPSTP